MLSSAFVMSLVEVDAKLAFNLSYQKGGRSFERFEKYKVATSARDALRLGASKADLKWDLSKGIGKLVDVKQQKDLEACLERKLQDVVAEGGGKVSIATNGVERLVYRETSVKSAAASTITRNRRSTKIKMYTCSCHSGPIPPRRTARKSMVRYETVGRVAAKRQRCAETAPAATTTAPLPAFLFHHNAANSGHTKELRCAV